MTDGWSWFIIVALAINLIGAMWMLQALSQRKSADDPDTTDHVWDKDLQEWNNPLPMWWLGLYWLTIVFTVIYFVLYPGFGNMPGILGWSQQGQHAEEVERADEFYGNIFAEFADEPLDELVNDPDAVRLGRNLFANYCATCHGSDARGARGFPNLTDADWLYGGGAQMIQASITNGRTGVMPALGTALGDEGTDAVVAHVLNLAGEGPANEDGKLKYTQFCASCHGVTGTGNTALGAPNLTNGIWLHGGDPADIRDVIMSGRVNQMPAQRTILNEDRIRTLVAYVQSLSSGQ